MPGAALEALAAAAASADASATLAAGAGAGRRGRRGRRRRGRPHDRSERPLARRARRRLGLRGARGGARRRAVCGRGASRRRGLRARRAAGGARRRGRRIGAVGALVIPLRADGSPLGSLELLRSTIAFDSAELAVARLAAAQLALVLRTGAPAEGGSPLATDEALRLVGDALAAGSDEREVAEQVARLAAEATGATAALLWRSATSGSTSRCCSRPTASTRRSTPPRRWHPSSGRSPHASRCGSRGAPGSRARARRHARCSCSGSRRWARSSSSIPTRAAPPGPTSPASRASASAPRTRCARASGQSGSSSSSSGAARSSPSSARRSRSSRSRTRSRPRSRASPSLLSAERLAIYLRDDGRLVPAAGRGLAGPHARVAEQLVELAVGPFRGRGLLVVENARHDPQLERVRDAVAESGIGAVVALPLGVGDEVIGLVAVYPERGRRLTENETALLRALAAQLAVAVQNATLHEEAMRSRDERELALQAEQQASRRLRALYEVSRTFAESLRLDETLDALARSVVELLEVDAAVIHVPSDRPELLDPTALAVTAERTRGAISGVLWRQLPYQPDGPLSRGQVARLDATTAAERGPVGNLLIPFLRPRVDGARRARACGPRAARDDDAALARPGAADRRGDDHDRRDDRRPGRARRRQRTPLRAAEGLRGHDAALAAPERAPGRSTASSWATSTRPRRASRWAATSTTTSCSRTDGSPSRSAT